MVSEELPRRPLAFLLFALGAMVLPHSQHVPVPIFLFFGVLWAWRLLILRDPRAFPGTGILFLLILLTVALLYREHRGFFGRDAGTSLFLLALGLKLLETKTRRDAQLLIDLAFIVAATQFLFVDDLAMAFYIIAVSIALLAVLVMLNRPQPGYLHELKTAASLILQAVPFMVVAFIFFPRLEAPRWMLLQDRTRALTGLSDTLEPGAISELGLSDELVFRVKFDGPIPPPALRYWRGPVFSEFDGKRWREAKFAETAVPAPLRFHGTPYRYTLLMEPQNKNWVFALEMPARYPEVLRRTPQLYLTTRKNPTERAEYALESFPIYATGALSAEERQLSIQLPAAPRPRIQQLVERLGGRGAPQDYITQVLRHFREERFYYTLLPPLLGDHPIETFLFETRRGFCEHYATAFVYLMRVAGLPARVVTGYQGGEVNETGKFLEIRQAHAHAWSEVWLSEQGWTRVDPTAAVAPERVERDLDIAAQLAQREVSFAPITLDARTLDLWRKTRQLWGHFDYQWQRWVIHYQHDNQSELFARWGLSDLVARVQMLMWLVLAATLLLAAWLLRANQTRLDPVRALYERFCRKLARHTLTRHPAEGPLAFAERASRTCPNARDDIAEITRLYLLLRYGAPPHDAASWRRFKDHVKRFQCR